METNEIISKHVNEGITEAEVEIGTHSDLNDHILSCFKALKSVKILGDSSDFSEAKQYQSRLKEVLPEVTVFEIDLRLSSDFDYECYHDEYEYDDDPDYFLDDGSYRWSDTTYMVPLGSGEWEERSCYDL